MKRRLRALDWLKRGTGLFVLAFGLLACGSSETGEIITFQKYDPGILYRARQEGRPVLLEFYAEWCIPCRELEQFTFSDRGVITSTWPFVKVRVDLTDYDSPEAERLREQFGVTGVPEVLFLDARGDELKEVRIIGFLGPEDFLQHVEWALEPAGQKKFPLVPGSKERYTSFPPLLSLFHFFSSNL